MTEPISAEQQARDLLERMGVEDAQSFSSGDLVELANLIANQGVKEDIPERETEEEPSVDWHTMLGSALAIPTPEVGYLSADAAWARVMDEVKQVAKRDVNTDQGFNFRGVDAVVNAMGPAMRKWGVKVIPRKVKLLSRTEYETRRNTRMVNSVVHVKWEIRGPGGDTIDGESIGEAADSGDKGISKAQSVAWRVFLIQAGALPTDDRDPDADSHERASAAVREGYQEQGDEMPAHIRRAIEEANEARGELLRRTQEYGWTEDKLVRRYWDDYRKNLRNTHDVEMINAFADLLVREAEAQERETSDEPGQGDSGE